MTRAAAGLAPALLATLLPAACAAPSAPPPVRSPAPLSDLVEDVRSLARPSNAERHEALVALLDARGLPHETRRFTSERRPYAPEGRNVVVTLGDGPRELLVGAHYDAVRLPDGTLADGAVDNGAGTVVLTRVAERLRARSLRHRVRILFFDMEENGLVGSTHYARALRDTAAVAAMVNVDVAGYGEALAFGPAAREGNAAVYGAMRHVCADLATPCLEFPAYPPSDDRSFQAAGIPNISIATMGRAEAHQLWLLLNGGSETGLQQGLVPEVLRIIHTPADTPARLEPAAMTLMVDAVTALVLRLDATLR